MRTTPRLVRGLLALEARIAPATDLILDFDGGSLQASQGYAFPANGSSGGTNTYSAFAALPSTSAAVPANRTQQILQIIAGVRADFADFNVAVFWDDRGVNSPLFGAHDTVIMITNDTNNNDIGQTAGVDLGNTTSDVGIVYGQTITSFPNGLPRKQIRTIVDTISRQAAYTFGVSNAAEPDAQQRQIVGISVPQNQELDSRFSTQALNHLDPEAGVVYSERDRLIQNVGAAVPGSQISPNEAHTGQTLPGDTTLNAIDPALNSGFLPFDQIDYHGDRDAFRFTLPFSGQYTFKERATVNLGNVDPVVTLWDADGNFLAAGSVGQANGVSAVTFTAVAGQTYYAVAGAGFDQVVSDPANNVLNGANGALALGPYSIEISPSWAEINTQTREIVVTGDNSANSITIDTVPNEIRVRYGNESIEVPSATVLGVRVNANGGDDNITINLNGQLPPIAVDGGAGNDTLTVNGSDAAEIFAVQPALIGVQNGVPISLAGLETATVNGAGGADSFLVTPSPTTTFNCNGGDPVPPTSSGDAIQPTDTNGTLTANGPGTGEYDFPSTQPVIFTGMETIFPLPPGGSSLASLAGQVYVDANHNGLFDSGEPGIPGVVLTVTGTTNGGTPVTRTATTGANGAFSFNLNAGNYALAESQPTGFLNGTAHIGTAGGVVSGDTINGITLTSGFAATGYDYGELTVAPPPPPPSTSLAHSFALGAAPGTAPLARLFRSSFSTANFQVIAYDQRFRGGVRVSTGDVTGDGVPDLITAPGAGGGPDIRVFDGTTGRLVREFLAYVGNFTGGVYVAAADVDGDGIADIVTGAGEGGGPHVKIFSGADGHLIREFMADDPNFRGGVRVAAQDVNDDGLADVVTGAGPGSVPVVKVFSGATGAVIREFSAYDSSFKGGVFVTAGDVTGDNHADIVTGAGEGGGAHVRVWDGATGQPLLSFFPYTLQSGLFLVPPRTWTAGVRVALADVNGDGIDELVVAPGRGQLNRVRVLDYQTLTDEATLDPGTGGNDFFGGAYVG